VKWRPNNSVALSELIDAVKTYEPQRLARVAKSFAHFLALTNSAENHHRIRRLRNALDAVRSPYGLWPKDDSCAGSLKCLVQQQGISEDEIFDALTSQVVDVVFTAHPTEVNRRTMLRKHLKIRTILEQLDRSDISLFERRKLNQDMRAQVMSLWNTDTLRRVRPTPVDEARFGFAIVENCLWEAVPNYLRKLDDLMVKELGRSLPLTTAPIRISSWMGGDRDGNPNVTPEITYEVAMLSRWMVATLYKQDVHELRSSLSMQKCTDELRRLVPNAREPYREYLRQLDARLQVRLN
jgi:phosphoenolpyruvate carboxylase